MSNEGEKNKTIEDAANVLLAIGVGDLADLEQPHVAGGTVGDQLALALGMAAPGLVDRTSRLSAFTAEVFCSVGIRADVVDEPAALLLHAVGKVLGFADPPAPAWLTPGAYGFDAACSKHRQILRIEDGLVWMEGVVLPEPLGWLHVGPPNPRYPRGLPCAACGKVLLTNGNCEVCAKNAREAALAKLRSQIEARQPAAAALEAT